MSVSLCRSSSVSGCLCVCVCLQPLPWVQAEAGPVSTFFLCCRLRALTHAPLNSCTSLRPLPPKWPILEKSELPLGFSPQRHGQDPPQLPSSIPSSFPMLCLMYQKIPYVCFQNSWSPTLLPLHSLPGVQEGDTDWQTLCWAWTPSLLPRICQGASVPNLVGNKITHVPHQHSESMHEVGPTGRAALRKQIP